jgi:hypothetical protein
MNILEVEQDNGVRQASESLSTLESVWVALLHNI